MTSLIKSGDHYKRGGYENLHHNSRAAWLQGRWLEVSEQERRAQLHNQKLLRDFQRAQDTLDDIVARTEAMNTIRVQYEIYLEENFPRWQQKLKDMRVSEQSKHVEKHLYTCSAETPLQQMEEDQGIKAQHRSECTVHPLSSNFPHQSQLPICHTLPNTHQTDKDNRQNATRCNQNDHAYLPPTWLTGPQPLISGLPQNNILKDYKNFHNIQALGHHLPPCHSLPCYPHHQSHSPVQQKSSSINHMYQNPLTEIRPTGHFTPTRASWPQLPVLKPMAWGMMDVPNPGVERSHCSEAGQENTIKEMLNPSEESNQRLKHKRKGREHDQSLELDCRPVRLLIDHKDSSEGSAKTSEVVKVADSGLKERTESQSTENGRQSHSSSTVSQVAESKKSKKPPKPPTAEEQDNSKEAKITITGTDVVKEYEEDDEQEESRSQEITPSNAGSDKSDGTALDERNSEEEDTDEGENSHDLFAEKIISERKCIDEGEEEKKGGRDDEEEAELDDKQWSEGDRAETEHSDGEESESEEDVPDVIPDSDCEEEAEHSDGEERESEGDVTDDIPDSDCEEEADRPEREINKNSSQEEQFQKVKGTGGGTFKTARKDENVNEAESDNNVDISERKVTNKSLKELYGDDETEEEVYHQEIDDDDEDDDEIVVEQAYPWTKDCSYDQMKLNDNDNEDIEDLLNPNVTSQIQKEDAVEETGQPNDLPSDSEDIPEKYFPAATNKPVESDDEFDHFYD